ncbi:MAG: RND family transporter [Acidobacteriota bacterium]
MNTIYRLRKGLLTRIASLTCRRPLLVVIACLVLMGIAALGLTHLRLETGIADYLPEDSPVVQRFTRAIEHYGSSDNLVIVISGNEDNAVIREELADTVARRLMAAGEVKGVEYRFGGDNPDAARSSIFDMALFYLDDDRLDEMASMLTPEAISARVRANKQLLRSPASLVAKDLVKRDPLGLSALFAEQFRSLKGNLDLRLMDGYAFSHDLEMLVMMVKPVEPAQNLAFTDAFLANVRRIIDESRTEVAAEVGPAPLSGVTVGLTGGYPIVSDYNALLRADLFWTVVTAFIGVMGLFLVAFRRIGSLLYVGLPLVVSVVWTMGFTGYAIGRLNLFTAGSAAVLMGLSIDFAIHMFNRYVSERDRGKDIDEAIRLMLVETGDGVITAGMTTVAAFAACTVGGIEGLAHLGIICASGMILGMAANFLMLPALLKLRGGRQRRESYHDSSFNFGLGWVSGHVANHPVAVIVIWIGLTGLFAYGATNVRVDTNMRSLRPNVSAAISLQKDLARKIGSGLVYSMVLVEDRDPDVALVRNASIAKRLDELVKKDEVVFYLSLASVLPPPERQRHVLDWMATHERRNPGLMDPERVAADLAAAMRAEGFRLGKDYEDAIALLSRFLKPAPRTMAQMLEDPTIRDRASRFMWQGPDLTELVTYVYPRHPPGNQQYRVVDHLEKGVIGDIPGAHVIGVSILGRELKRLIQRGALAASALAFFLVVFLLWIHFRSVRSVALTAVPLIVGVLGAVGGMSLLGLDLNMVNMSMVAIILGIGIDDGIHIVHRFLDEGHHEVVATFRFAGRAVVITSLTTMVGFGSMAFASYKGLWTAGVFAILGVGMCLLSSVTLLPALLQAFVVRPERRAAGRGPRQELDPEGPTPGPVNP